MNWVVLLCVSATVLSCANPEAGEKGQPLSSPTGEGVAPAAIPAVSDLMQSEAASNKPRSNEFSATGTLFPREQAELGPKVTGVIRSIEVDEGDTVKKGQVVFRLDGSQPGLMLQQAQTQVASAKTQLRATELEYNRAKELNARGSLPAAQFEQYEARHEAAQNGVAQAEVAVSMAKRSIADTVVASPIDGVVTQRNKEPGETATMMPVTVVVVVQDVSVLELRARLPEAVLKTLRVASPLEVNIPAIGVERTVPVKRINPVVDMATRTVEVIAEIDNVDGTLKPGMLANVTVAKDKEEGAQPASTSAPQKSAGAKP
jgi:RND family efflux transporter MFP subunit